MKKKPFNPPKIMPLLDFPNELILLIAENLPDVKSLSALILTNRRLASLLTPHLHLRANEDKNGIPALLWAAWRGHESLVRLLLDMGADIDMAHSEDKKTALHKAVWYEHLGVLRVLLDKGANIHARATHGYTVLHLVAIGTRNSSEAIARFLLDRGADPDVQNEHKVTPLHLVVQQTSANLVAIAKLFLEKGAKRNPRNGSGDTPLHHATRFGRKEMVKLLLDSGADVNALDYFGDTALHIAIERHNEPCAKILLAYGADPYVKNCSGNTVWDWVHSGAMWESQEDVIMAERLAEMMGKMCFGKGSQGRRCERERERRSITAG